MDTMQKLMKCASNDDILTLKSEENGDLLTITFENPVTRADYFNLNMPKIRTVTRPRNMK